MQNLKINLLGNTRDIMSGIAILQKKINITLCETGIPVTIQEGQEQLTVKRAAEGYYIGYSEKVEFFRGLALLCNAIRENKDIEINEKRQFGTVGSMLDCSIGYVFKKEVILDLLEYHALMGLNMFMLYTEDTYELEGYPWFGYLRGKYSKEELKEIDDFAYAFGIEVIPCIQTLGHLATTLRWPAMEAVKDTASELLVGVEETYVFIEAMIKTMRECFRSNRIHIGMDEAIDLGKGNYKKLFGERNNQNIMTEHLQRVSQIIEKYNYSPMIWSDMFFRMTGKTGEYDITAEIPSTLKDTLPKNLEMVYWDYCKEDRNITDKVIRMHQEMERPVVFAGGIWTWLRSCTGFKKSYDTAKEQLISCAKHKLDTVFATIWAGRDCDISLYSILPGLQIWAELTYKTDADKEFIWERFHACTGYNPEEWKLLYADDFTEEEKQLFGAQSAIDFCINSASQHFYSDVFFGFLDKTFESYDFKAKYDKLRNAISEVCIEGMQSLFDRQRILYEIAYIKADMGSRIRAAYVANDRVLLKELSEELAVLTELYRQYHDAALEMWFDLCKPFGYGYWDRKLGGMEVRTRTAKQRIDDYLQGKYNCLPELEEEILPYNNDDKPIMELNIHDTFLTML